MLSIHISPANHVVLKGGDSRMKNKKENLSAAQLQALADQYGGLPNDEHKRTILAPVLEAIPRRQRQVFFQILDSRKNVGERHVVSK